MTKLFIAAILSLNVHGKGKTMTTYPARQISVTIHRSPSDVYKFASQPQNITQWAAGLANSKLTASGAEWIAESPMGKIRIKFAPENSFGVLDHDVTLPNGEVNHNPLRVVKNGEGSEVIFTLYRMPKVSDKDFEHDAGLIAKDLRTLKSLLEK